MIRYLLVLLVTLLAVSVASARHNSPSGDTLNPVIRGDFADPSVIRIGNRYYAAGTSSEWAPHFPIYVSDDLVNWKQLGHIFPVKQAWMSSSFWAPELYWMNNRLYAYYTVRDTNGISCIGVATADSPGSAFKDHGVLIRTGKEAIDPFVFNDSGQLHISWKAYGLDKRPIELLSSTLSADGLSLTGEPVSIKKDAGGKGLEGQSIIKRNGYYYLFYSAGSCCGVPCDYNVRVSRAKSVTGPYEDFGGNPVLKEGGEWMCTGHGTPVQTNDNKWFYLFHAYNKSSNVFTGRQALIKEILWDDNTGWPSFKQPGGLTAAKGEWIDDFSSSDLSLSWSWDFRHSDMIAKIEKGVMVLTGNIKAGNTSGTAICLRTVTPDYEISTGIENVNSALKGLVLYGDYNSNAGIGVKDDSLIIWSTKNDKTEILKTLKVLSPKSIRLKMVVAYGRFLKFFYNNGDNKWRPVPLDNSGNDGLDVSYTRQWDRAPRPGLIHKGKASEPARFEWCRISNN